MKNPYQGINAHLNSLLQTSDDGSQPALWSSFHASHINHIADFLNDELPDGYIAMSEQSLQVRADLDMTIKRPRPDVSVSQQSKSLHSKSGELSRVPTWQAEIVDTIDADEFYTAVAIYQVEEQGKLGQVVSRIELLSPSNMPHQSAYSAYRMKRIENLRSGIPLIEIDYLHEFASPIVTLPHYPSDENAVPYYIALSDPRPTWDEGIVQVFGSHVNEPLKQFPIPLAGDIQILFDIDAVYQHTFERRRYSTLVNYDDMPIRFNTYSESDKGRIYELIA